ncbi:50S ribosomal protein L25 [Candidatus Peregrinibacteria bacterium]|jgi:large subunit ribosomal protein L25|nr:50S ribosomal protein L25 [Candidatus Peregrinibacteria bacterium]MBT3598826.1 50S ribosomal protein L25 [Candidatus Peregrinibacteria bacterium]MBT4585404.1 50S ribosomal protein L25 [Candidatus Peregrinibacteria bacterium]MBT6731164.1 50S ribosomal protein L25 [Candidatus Peregrinibacteria bacterium]MBT7009204.1 50S ribosomal protein L25 [Candidatus Peregrinibacteria bacterium]
MDTISLTVTARSSDVTVSALRRDGKVPCVIYGNEQGNQALECVYGEVYKAYASAGESTIVELILGDTMIPVLFHEIQQDPVTDKVIHVDFFAVNMKKEIEAQIPLEFEGESPAVKDLGAMLVTAQDHVQVRCLPSNLPHKISISVESVLEIGSSLQVSDITPMNGVEILDDPTVVLLTAQEPRSAVEEKQEDEEPVEGEEGSEEGKEGGEEGKEGESADKENK